MGNTCHFGLNNMFADNGLDDTYETRLYFPCEVAQAQACVRQVFWDKGLRFLFTTRSKTPAIQREDGTLFYDNSYQFRPGHDDIIRRGRRGDGIIITYGDAVYRCLDAVERLRKE